MEQPRQQKTRPGAPTGTYNLVPAGLAQTKRRFLAARFPEKDGRAPRFVPTPGDGSRPPLPAEDYILAFAPQPARQKGDQQQQQQQQQKDASLLLTRKAQKGSGTKQLQGQPRTDDRGNYFMLSKGGGARDFVLQPLDATFTFKQLSRAPALSIDEVEAQMRAAGGGGADPGARLLPKSMRQQMQESAAAAAAEKQLQEEVVPLFDKQKVAELSVKYGGPSTQDNKLVVGHSDDEEGSDEGWGLNGADDDMPSGNARKRGPGKDKGKPGPKGGGAKGRKGGKDDPDSIPEDEMPEDIFAGEEDELRPAAPVEDADWEYNEDAADDDLDQGASDEEGLADDPGYRKQLGLEADEEEEEKKEEGGEGEGGEGGEGAKPGEGAAAGGAGAGGAGGSQAASVGGSVESESVMDDDELGAEVMDAEDLDRLAEEREHSVGQPAKRRKGSVGPPGRDRSPAPSRLATPPLGSTAAAAGGSRATPPLGGRRGSTPPLGRGAAAGGGSRQGSAAAGGSRKTPPPGAAGAARRTPPPAGAAAAAAAAAAGAAKRKREEAAVAGVTAGVTFAAGAAAAAAGAGGGVAAAGGVRGYVWRPEQLDAQGVPTVESVGQALSEMGPITTSQLSLLQEHLDVARIGDEGKKLLKQRMLQVAKVESRNGVKYVVLKHAA